MATEIVPIRMAPDDGIWVCAACGKTALDRYGIEGPRSTMWDESCMLNAVLCRRGNIVPGETIRSGRYVSQHGWVHGAEPYES